MPVYYSTRNLILDKNLIYLVRYRKSFCVNCQYLNGERFYFLTV